MRDVFGLGVRWFGGAAFLVAAFWLFHPSMEAACRHFGPGVCLQSVWAPDAAKVEPPTIANPSEEVSFDKALDALRASRKAGDFAVALDRLDTFGRVLLRHYEAEEAKGATRRVRYWFLHGDLQARKLSAEAALRGEAQMAAKANQYAQIFASLASVESIDLVLREAKLRAPNDLTGALLSPTLREAIKAFWQDLAPVPVFYATNRARLGDEDGAFDDLAGEVEAISWGLATVSAPVYASPVFAIRQREEADAAVDAGASQTVAVRTIKSLDPEGFDALLSARAGEQGLIFVHGRQTPFEIAAIRAAELASALRIEGPVMVLSWAAGRPCDDPHIAKLVFAGWKKLASAPTGRPPILVAHGEGACASQAPFTAAQGLAPSELPLTRAIMLDPHWAAGGQDGGPRPLTQYLPARAQASLACPWDAAPRPRRLGEPPASDPEITVQAPEGVPSPLSGDDFYLSAILDDLRAELWLKTPVGTRCGQCAREGDGPTASRGWHLTAGRCSQANTLALEMRREHGSAAEARLDQVLAELSPEERSLVRERLGALPVSP